ncbi:DUF47 family protein, partial [Candidatus Bipolaricaulota bacterium]|nr:DUF47 family protein [Candidatus Bipolaricaulota bacterium]
RDYEKASEYALATHKAEGAADDIRRKVEQALISGALLPPSRRQILEIVERVDTLANAAEASLDRLLVENVAVPESIVPYILQILGISLSIFEDVECTIRLLFEGQVSETMVCVDRIEMAEGQIDHLERDALKNLFSLDIELASKLHVSGYFSALVKISDRAEDLSDVIALSAALQSF